MTTTTSGKATPGPWTSVRIGREGDGTPGSAEVQICNADGRAVAIIVGDGSPEWVANVEVMREAYDRHQMDLTCERLFAAWLNEKQAQIPWNKAVQLIAIVTKMSEAEHARLLTLDGEDPRIERLREALQSIHVQAADAQLRASYQRTALEQISARAQAALAAQP